MYFIVMTMYSYVCLCMATLTEGFPCFFLSCKAKGQGKTSKDGGTARTLPNFCVVVCIVCFVSFCVLFVCTSVLYYCHRVATHSVKYVIII
jgi:hypothetical protein